MGGRIGDLQRDFYNAAYSPLNSGLRTQPLDRLVKRFELHRTEVVFRLLPRGGTLLDVGCGDGGLLARCAPFFDHVVGVDIADVRLQAARQRRSGGRSSDSAIVLSNVDHGLPFSDECFDVVTAVATIGFLFDPIAAVAERQRVLRIGGSFVVEVLNLAYLPRRLALLMGFQPILSRGYGWDGGSLHNFTLGTLKRLLQRHGLAVERCTGSGVFAPLRSWRPSLLTGNLIVRARKL